MSLHREGTTTIILCLLFVIGVWGVLGYFFPPARNPKLIGFFVFLGIFFLGIILNFFRNPDIKLHINPLEIIAPCDGKVVVIEETVESIYFKKAMMQVSIFMSPLNVHVNRNPISGTVSFQKYFPGKYLMAFNPKSSTDNEHNFVVIKNEETEVGFKQIAGFLARRICHYVREGDNLNQGEEMGFIKFGSRMDIFFPVGYPIEVKMDQVVKGGQTVIAKIKN